MTALWTPRCSSFIALSLQQRQQDGNVAHIRTLLKHSLASACTAVWLLQSCPVVHYQHRSCATQHQQARSNWEKAQAEELQHQQQLAAAAEYARTHQKRQRVKDAGVHSIVESSQHSVRPDTLQAPRTNTQTAADVQRGSSTQQVRRRVQRIIVSTSNFQR
jgi:hypothetical protein